MGYFFSLLLSLPSKSETETLLDISEIVLIVSGFVLFFGAVGEYLEEHGRLPRWMRWPKLTFIIMVVVSLVGEFASDAGVFLFSRHLQTISEGEFATFNKEAGAARKEAGAANERAAAAIEHAARLERNAKKEARLRRQVELSIAFIKKPRRMIWNERISRRLAAFADTPYFAMISDNGESISLATSILELLTNKCKWKYVPPPNIVQTISLWSGQVVGKATAVGIFVRAESQRSSAGRALLEWFEASDIGSVKFFV
jgi:hypothetical protein